MKEKLYETHTKFICTFVTFLGVGKNSGREEAQSQYPLPLDTALLKAIKRRATNFVAFS
jgi:hypothetical protein